jgi:hypothetical protein
MQKVAVAQLYLNRAAALCGMAIAVSLFLYGGLLLSAVSHAAVRTAAEREMREISASISALEAKYFEATRAITPERAREMGFTAPVSSVTVFATAASRAVTLETLRAR